MAKKFRVILIEEGLGNLKSRFYYTRKALESAQSKKLFEGAPCKADHPSSFEEQTRPEGSINKIIGHYENVAVENGDTGQAQLAGDLVLLDSPDYDKYGKILERAVSHPEKFGKDFIGLSVNASGEANPISLVEFLKSGTIPKSALPKLEQAQAEGILEIEVCDEFLEAESCDLVTVAGAKGRVVKMLEKEGLRMSKIVKKVKQDGAAPGAAPAQDDGDQDKELVKGMLKKYMGDGDHPEEMHQAMKSAMCNAKEMGLEGEEAEKAAGYAMKMAHHQAKKESEAEETEESEEEDDAPPPAAADGAGAPPSGMPPKKSKESAKLLGEIASLRETVSEMKAEKLRESAVKGSGLRGESAKLLIKALSECDSEKEITKTLKLFKEAHGAGVAGSGMIYSPEKTVSTESDGDFSLADCKKEF